MLLDYDRLRATKLDGVDLIVFATDVVIDVFATIYSEKSEERLIDLANRIDDYVRRMPEGRHRLLLAEFSKALMGTERHS